MGGSTHESGGFLNHTCLFDSESLEFSERVSESLESSERMRGVGVPTVQVTTGRVSFVLPSVPTTIHRARVTSKTFSLRVFVGLFFFMFVCLGLEFHSGTNVGGSKSVDVYRHLFVIKVCL